MEGNAWGQAADLKADLLKNGKRYSFFQALRLLKNLARAEFGVQNPLDGAERRIWIRPSVMLDFPESDIESIEELPDGKGYLVTATFLGLYGVSSPLPTFYSEDIIDQLDDGNTAVREFLDIFHYAVYPVFFRAWEKYRIPIKVLEEKDGGYLQKLYSLVGLSEPEMRKEAKDAYELIRYAGLFSHFPRSYSGLEALIADALPDIPVDIEYAAPHWMAIPRDQRARVGVQNVTLGGDSYLGEQIEDRMNHIKITVGPLDRESAMQFLPPSKLFEKFKFLVSFYVLDTVKITLDILARPEGMYGVGLGAKAWNRLGVDSWVTWRGQTDLLKSELRFTS